MVLALTDDEKATILGIIGPYCDQTKVASGINTQTEVDAQPTVVVLQVKQQEGGGGVIKVPPAAKSRPWRPRSQEERAMIIPIIFDNDHHRVEVFTQLQSQFG